MAFGEVFKSSSVSSRFEIMLWQRFEIDLSSVTADSKSTMTAPIARYLCSRSAHLGNRDHFVVDQIQQSAGESTGSAAMVPWKYVSL